jgi:hypothetical protein
MCTEALSFVEDNVQLLINKDVDSTLGIDAVHRALATFVRKVSYLPLTGR